MLTEQNGIQVDKFYPPTDWQYSFPEGYTRLEYLEGTGTQWLNTGITASQDLRVRTKIYSKSKNNQSVFCTRSSQGSNNFALLLVNGYFRPCYNTTYSNSDLKYNINTLYDVDFNKNNFYVDGELVKTFTYNTFSNDVSMRIANSINAGEIYYIGRIYPYLIYNNDVLVANLIPVKRNSDGELGMLDLIQDVFRTNRGTGTFIAGPELYLNNSQIDIRQKNNINFVEKYKFNENNELIWANPQLNLSGPVNYSVVGSPTITDNVVSEFSDSNYIELQQPFILNVNTISEIIIKINFDNESSGQVFLGHPNTYGIQMIRSSGDSKIHLYLGNNNSWSLINNAVGTTVLSSLTNYYIKVVFNKGNVQVLLSTDKINWTTEINRNITLTQEYSYIIDFGKGRASNQYLKGSIDLKEIYIKVNDEMWFYGKNYTSENYAPVPAGLNCKIKGPVNYTEVGTLTNNDGIYSGFSANDYLTATALDCNKNFELNTVFTTASNWTSSGTIITNNLAYRGGVVIDSKSIRFQCRTTVPEQYALAFDTQAVASTKYTVNCKREGNTLTIRLYVNDVLTETKTDNLTGITFSVGNNLMIGYGNNGQFNGSIDLNNTYIKINNQLLFGTEYTTPSIGYVNTQTQEFIPAPTDGIKYSQTRDLKVIPPEDNTITLLYGVASDFSKYSLFGLLASVSSGNYDVYIDDVLYATTTKNTQTDIDFSTLCSEYVPIGTCTTPEELVLHKIVVKPNTNGSTITQFRCARTTGVSTNQQQGVLWGHFELDNSIALNAAFSAGSNQYIPIVLQAVTAKNDSLNVDVISTSFRASSLYYLPKITNATNFNSAFRGSKLKHIRIRNYNGFGTYTYDNCTLLEKISINEVTKKDIREFVFNNNYNLKLLPFLSSTRDNLIQAITCAQKLYPTKIDITDNTTTKLGMYGTSTYPMRGLRGLKVSNEAPFTETSPQINVSYTGLDRDALVELFNSMPYNVGYTVQGTLTESPSGVFSGFSENDYLEITNNLNFNSENLEIVIKIHTPPTLDANRAIFGIPDPSYWYAIVLQENYRPTTVLRDSNNNIFYVGTGVALPTDTDCLIKFTKNGNNLRLSQSTNNGDSWTNGSIIQKELKTINNKVYIGRGGYYANPFTGSIDLNNTYIKIKENNEWIPWFTGKAATTKAINITAATGNNLTNVGTPKIDENGVASGFSSSDYVKINSFTPSLNTNTRFKVYTKFSITNTISSTCNICGISSWYTFGIIIGDNKKIRGVSNINNQYYYCNSDIIVQLNATYYCIFEIDVTKGIQILGVSTDNINFSYFDTEITKQNYISNVLINYQFGYGSYGVFNGTIDLENTYIKVGQNYLMKGYLTDNDKAILTKKNWTIIE